MAQGLTQENFDSFSPQNMNLTNVESSNTKTFKFNLARNTQENHVFRFGISPVASGNTYCVTNGEVKGTIALNAPIVTSNDEEIISQITDDKLGVTYNGGRYSLSDSFFEINKEIKDGSFLIDLSSKETLPEDFTSTDLTIYANYEDNNLGLQYEDSVEIRLQACESEEEQGNDSDGNSGDEETNTREDSERENEEGIGN